MSIARTHYETDVNSTDRAEPGEWLRFYLHELQRSTWKYAAGAASIICLTVIFAGLSAFGWLDGYWELSATARTIAFRSSVLAGLATASVAFLFVTFQHSKSALARKLDAAGESHGQILTGWDLLRSGATGSRTTRAMAKISVSRAGDFARQIKPATVMPRKNLLYASYGLGIVTLGLLFAMIVAPRFVTTEWLRFLDPRGDHPPYSPYTFLVDPGEVTLTYGDGLEVFVRVAGGEVDHLELVLETKMTTAEASAREVNGPEVLPMYADGSGLWHASFDRLREPAHYFVRAGRARSHRFPIHIQTVPQITNATFRLEPPAYTGLNAVEGSLSPNGLRGLPQSRVTIRATSNRPLSEGIFRLRSPGEGEQSVILSVTDDDPKAVIGEFAVEHEGTFQLELIDQSGQRSSQSLRGNINLINDEPPLVRIVQPRAQSLATPTANLPVIVSAEDDYGVSTVSLYRSLNGSRPTAVHLHHPSIATRTRINQVLPLQDYELQVGDKITVFARAEDNRPNSPQGAESKIATIKIISEEEMEELVRRRQGLEELASRYREARRRLANVREKIDDALAKLDQQATDEEKKRVIDKLLKTIEQQRAALEEMSKRPSPYDLEKSLEKELDRLQADLEQAKDKLQSTLSLELTPEEMKSLLKSVKQSFERRSREFEKSVVEPVEFLEDVFPLIADQLRFVILANRQLELAERLGSMRNETNVSDPRQRLRLRELEDEQRRTRDGLRRLLTDIENHAEQLPDLRSLREVRKSAFEFVDDVRMMAPDEMMSHAETSMSQRNAQLAYEHASHAAEILAKFIRRCSNNAQGAAATCQLRFQPSKGSAGKLGKTIAQLLNQMGLGSSAGSGNGSGQGSSATRSPQPNVGLYGAQAAGGPNSSGKDADRLGGRRRGSMNGGYELSTQKQATMFEGGSEADGSGKAAIPSAYRKKVEDYFRAIADEVNSN